MVVAIEVKLALGFAEEVRVTASAIDDRFSDRDELGSVTTITGKAIEEQHVRNVVQVLQAVPGVTPDLYGGSDTVKIKFRGVESQRFYAKNPAWRSSWTASRSSSARAASISISTTSTRSGS
jgi:hypothetical protein